MLTLYHLRISHYSEKVRWALDYKGLQYRSRLLTPGFHILTVRRVAGISTVPVLTDSDSQTALGESTDILHYLDRICPDPQLFPIDGKAASRVAEIEDLFDTGWGPNAASFMYSHYLEDREYLRQRWSEGLALRQRAALAVASPLIIAGLRRRRGLSPERTEEFRSQALAALDEAGDHLEQNGGGYMVAGDFTAADLTGAALVTPFLVLPNSPWAGFASAEVPPEIAAFRTEVAAHPVGEWAAAIWSRHRYREAPRTPATGG